MSSKRWVVALVVLPVVATLLIAAAMGVRLWNITSESMQPAIPARSAVLTLPLEPELGQPHVYADPDRDRVVAHRLVGQDRDGLVFHGDAVTVRDSPVQADQILGRVVLTVPGAGQAIAAASAVGVALTVFLLAYALMPAGFFKH